jgi:hypothetical protein
MAADAATFFMVMATGQLECADVSAGFLTLNAKASRASRQRKVHAE